MDRFEWRRAAAMLMCCAGIAVAGPAAATVYRTAIDNHSGTHAGFAFAEPNTTWRIVAEADFNGDGFADLLWRDTGSGDVFVQLFVDGASVAGSTVYREADRAWKIVQTPDLDGDGKADILWWNASTGGVYALLMNGISVSAQGFVYREPNTAWKIAAAGDFAGSGRRNQLLWRNASTGQLYLMTVGRSGGRFTVSGRMIYREPDTAWNVVGAADFDGDGKSDILYRHAVTGVVWMLLMDGPLVKATGRVLREDDAAWRIMAFGDYDQDGKRDLLWRHEATGQVYMMLMDGRTVAFENMVFQPPEAASKLQGATEDPQAP